MNKFAMIIILLGLGLLTIEAASAPRTILIINEEIEEFIEPELNPELVTESPIITTLKEFMKRDTTSDKLYSKGYYDCGHFARDLSGNAAKENIEIGSILLHYDPDGEGYGGHALNYIIIDDVFYIIDPQCDFIIPWEDYIHNKVWKYYRLYPKGDLIPTRWDGKLHGLKPINELSDEYAM